MVLSNRRKFNTIPCRKSAWLSTSALGVMVALVFNTVPDLAHAQQTSNLLRQSVTQDPFANTAGDPSVVPVDDGLNITQNSGILGSANSTGSPTDPNSIGQTGQVGTAPVTVDNFDGTNQPVQPATRVGASASTGLLNSRENPAASAIENRPSNLENDPYAATGFRLGSFTFFPTLEQYGGHTSNADFTRNGAASSFSATIAGLRGQSDWARHELAVQLGATYLKFFNGTSEAQPTANASVNLRLDLARGYTGRIGGTYDLTTEDANTDNLVAGIGAATIANRPKAHTGSVFAEIAKSGGKLGYSLRGSLTRNVYQDAQLTNGNSLSQSDRANNLAVLTARLTYQHSPAIAPFVEASVGRRIYDVGVDRNGFRRDGNNYALRGGLTFDFTEKLTGEIAVGRTRETFADSRIQQLDATTVDARLAWSPMRLTTITSSLQTTINPSTAAGENGSVLYSGALSIRHLLNPELTLTAGLAASIQDYDASGREDTTLGVNAGFEYELKRGLALSGLVDYQKVKSTERDSNYSVFVWRLGFRIRR